MTKYQSIFNKALTRIRYATSGALLDNEPLMRAIVKILYDFSDELKANNIIRTEDNNETSKQQNILG